MNCIMIYQQILCNNLLTKCKQITVAIFHPLAIAIVSKGDRYLLTDNIVIYLSI